MPTITTQQAMELALQHFNAGRREEARQLCEQIIASFPQHWPAMLLLAVMKHQGGDPVGGIELLRRVIEIEPSFADAHNNLGEMLRSIGRFDEAAKCFARCLELDPKSAPTYSNLGELYRQQRKFDEAIASYRKSLELEPNNPTPWMNMAVALHENRKVDEAIECYRKAIAISPGYADAHGNLGAALMDAARPEEAMAEFELAVRLQPNSAVTHVNLGTAQTYLHRMDEALATLQRAVSLDPRWGEAHANLSYALLLTGDFAHGFEEYEWRWTGRMRNLRREFKQPMWDGSDPSGKRILVYPEQGLGDAIQFARYVPLLADRGAEVILEAYPSQKSLMESVRGVSQVIDRDQNVEFDLQIPILSLPRAFRTTPDTIPASVPYVSVDTKLIEAWREKVGDSNDALRVGLVWAGRMTYTKDLIRSMPLAKLAPLRQVEGVRWFSLQLGPQADEPAPPGMELIRLYDQIKDFSDSAALLSNLDLLITVDTAQAHLAGALALPVWNMIPFSGDWRWGLTGETSAWYPTMRLFRQPRIGDWDSVISNVAAELTAKVADHQS